MMSSPIRIRPMPGFAELMYFCSSFEIFSMVDSCSLLIGACPKRIRKAELLMMALASSDFSISSIFWVMAVGMPFHFLARFQIWAMYAADVGVCIRLWNSSM